MPITTSPTSSKPSPALDRSETPADREGQCSKKLITVRNTNIELTSRSLDVVFRYDYRCPEEIAKSGFKGNRDLPDKEFQAFGKDTVYGAGSLEGATNFRSWSLSRSRETIYLYEISANKTNNLDFSFSNNLQPEKLNEALCAQYLSRAVNKSYDSSLSALQEQMAKTIQSTYIWAGEIHLEGPIPHDKITHIGTDQCLLPNTKYNSHTKPKYILSSFDLKRQSLPSELENRYIAAEAPAPTTVSDSNHPEAKSPSS